MFWMGAGGFNPVYTPGESYDCKFGRSGWLGRAVRDAVRTDGAGFRSYVVAVVVALAAALVPVGSHEGDIRRVLYALAGFAVGMGIVALWTLTPWGRRAHWQPQFYVSGNGLTAWVVSHHWHVPMNLRLRITGPGGDWTAMGQLQTLERTPPGRPAGTVEVTNVVGNPIPGVYRFRWLIDTVGR